MSTVPRNIYNGEIDFTALALQYPNFAKKQLTKSLLHRDFGLEIELPEDRLCPPVPNRLNYIFWLQDLLDTTGDDYRDRYDADREVVGLDIGTGASAVYPLLGCRLRDKWKFIGTGNTRSSVSPQPILTVYPNSDIDPKSLEYAKTNISRNNLSDSIKLIPTTPSNPLIPLSLISNLPTSLSFTMCNPPFYSSPEELLHSASLKSRPPHSSCTGAPVEMVTPGGELAFTNRLIEESLVHRNEVQWYTTMVGKLSSVQTIVERLMEIGCGNYAVTEFVQGGKTRRWGVGWSWGDLRPKTSVARGITGFPKHLLPFPSETALSIPNGSLESVGRAIDAELRDLDLQWQWRPNISTGVGLAPSNVWSRQARRKKAHRQDEVAVGGEGNGDGEDKEDEVALGFKIAVRRDEDGGIQVLLRWLRGTDAKLFESFCGMLKRRLEGR
ncbi:MAG: hypothetical protein Q9160_007746 [Pyrenula sp. 1 TL-2023]